MTVAHTFDLTPSAYASVVHHRQPAPFVDMPLFCRFFFSQNAHPKPQNNTPRNTPINTSDPRAIGRPPVAVFAVWPVSGVRFADGCCVLFAGCLFIRHGFPQATLDSMPVAASCTLFGGSPMCCRWWSMCGGYGKGHELGVCSWPLVRCVRWGLLVYSLRHD